MISIYSSYFNVQAAGFSWRETLANWQTFLNGRGEIVVAVNTSTDDTPNLIRQWSEEWVRKNPSRNVPVKVIDAAIPYDDPEFDGRLKALALSHCTQPFCTLLDCDEVIAPQTRDAWYRLAFDLERMGNLDAYLIPVIDLFHSEKHYRCEGQNLGAKWYLHKNRPDITRGVVKWAYRENGSIDITKSDTCDLIRADSRELVSASPTMLPIPHFMSVMLLATGQHAFVYHLGWLEKERRMKQDAFWEPVWQNRDKTEVKTARSREDLDGIQYYGHNLPDWRAS